MKRFGWLPEVGIVLLAATMRAWQLGYHSIWFDEAVSLEWAGADAIYAWDMTFELAKDKHPPLYYLYLHVWQETLGRFGLEHNDAALRVSGVVLGVLAVVGLLFLAGRLSGRRTALVAGLFVALSPILTWYSQELRMFAPATTALVWGGCCLVGAWGCDRGWGRLLWWSGMAAALLAAVYAYLFSALALPAAGLSLVLLWYVARRGNSAHEVNAPSAASANRRLLEGVGAFAVVAVAFLPLARNAWLVNSSEGAPAVAFAHVGETMARLLRVYTVWRPPWPVWLMWSLLALFTVLLLVGLIAPGRARGSVDRAWLLLWIFVPFGIGNLLLATTDSVFAEDRYFLFLAPFVLWAIARGCVVLMGWVPSVGYASAAVVGVSLLASLPVLWTPAMQRENWRAASEVISEHFEASPGGRPAVITHVDYTHLPMEWYLRQKYSFEEIPVYFPFADTLTPEQVESVIAPPLRGVETAGYDTLWLAQSHLEGVDDGRLVQGWLDQNYPLISEAYPPGVDLAGYATKSRYAQLPALASGATEPDMELAPGLRLAACEVVEATIAAREDTLHPPSNWVHVRLWWQGSDGIEDDYLARIQLADANGIWGEGLDRAGDTLRVLPTSTWEGGGFVRHEADVNLNPETPTGTYELTVRLLDDSGVEVGPKASCGMVTVDNE